MDSLYKKVIILHLFLYIRTIDQTTLTKKTIGQTTRPNIKKKASSPPIPNVTIKA